MSDANELIAAAMSGDTSEVRRLLQLTSEKKHLNAHNNEVRTMTDKAVSMT